MFGLKTIPTGICCDVCGQEVKVSNTNLEIAKKETATFAIKHARRHGGNAVLRGTEEKHKPLIAATHEFMAEAIARHKAEFPENYR
jgi:hypothetical protein